MKQIQRPVVPWISWWIKELAMNVNELSGFVHSERIIQYHSYTTLKATDDETPWCSAAMCACFAECGLDHTKSAAAKSWASYGLPLSAFVLGAIAVFERGGHVGAAHVAIALAEDNGIVTVIGGNQKDAVSIENYPKSKLIAYRWPKGFDLLEYYKTFGADS